MLYVDVKINETLQIGDVTLTLVKKTGQLARLYIDADKDKVICKVDKGIGLHVRENDIIHP